MTATAPCAMTLPKSKHLDVSLRELVESHGLDPDLFAAFDQEESAQSVLTALREEGRGLDCVRLLVHVGEPRRAVWWGQQCLCGQEAELVDPGDAHDLALEIERWLTEPTDEARRAIGKQADALKYADPVSCLGLGVFLAEGSLAPPDIETVPPPAGVAARAVGGALVLHCVTAAPGAADALAFEFLDAGIAILELDPPWAGFQSADSDE